MAETVQRVLPAPFVEALGQTFADQLTTRAATPIDTSKFAPTVAAQDPLQTQAATLAASGVGAFQPFLTSAAARGTEAATQLGGVPAAIQAADLRLANVPAAITAAQQGLTDDERDVLNDYNQGLAKGGMPTGIMRTNTAGIKERDYRDEGGCVPVGIKEKADHVPAMLSKNEFVMTADAVRGAGDGSIEKGAQKMYDTMKKLEDKVA